MKIRTLLATASVAALLFAACAKSTPTDGGTAPEDTTDSGASDTTTAQ